MDPYDIVEHPYVTEKTLMLIENNNSLQFVVRDNATKKMIKEAIEKIFEVKVDKVTTRITKKGKIATVKLSPEYKADDIGMRIGIF
ncbi:MAG TPA: 50S ribosomal protein L23 [Thermoplasmatales archaeon]|nr:50S ribosomal protein L23 [Thermoplasmatales archaeon]